MENKFETFGRLIDDIENLAYMLEVPMSPSFHVEQLKKILPEKVAEFKKVFVDITGENPWQ